MVYTTDTEERGGSVSGDGSGSFGSSKGGFVKGREEKGYCNDNGAMEVYSPWELVYMCKKFVIVSSPS